VIRNWKAWIDSRLGHINITYPRLYLKPKDDVLPKKVSLLKLIFQIVYAWETTENDGQTMQCSVCCLSYSRAIASTEAPYPGSAVYCSPFQVPVYFPLFNLSQICLRLLPRIPVTYIFPSVTCFRRQFLRTM
jgi:hypothetical protein